LFSPVWELQNKRQTLGIVPALPSHAQAALPASCQPPRGSTGRADPAPAVPDARWASPHAGRALPTTTAASRPAAGGKQQAHVRSFTRGGERLPAGFCNLPRGRSGQTIELGPRRLRAELPSVHAQTGLGCAISVSSAGLFGVFKARRGKLFPQLVLTKLTSWKFPQLDFSSQVLIRANQAAAAEDATGGG